MKSVLVPTLVAAKDVDIYNASFISTTSNIDNGNVFGAGTLTNQVYAAVAPATGSLGNLWMAFSPEDTIITDAAGNQYKIGLNDPRNFTNVQGKVFSAFKPQVGDKILITEDGISGTADDYVEAVDGAYKLAYSASQTSGSLCFKVVDADAYISIGSASAIGSQRVEAVLLECIAN